MWSPIRVKVAAYVAHHLNSRNTLWQGTLYPAARPEQLTNRALLMKLGMGFKESTVHIIYPQS